MAKERRGVGERRIMRRRKKSRLKRREMRAGMEQKERDHNINTEEDYNNLCTMSLMTVNSIINDADDPLSHCSSLYLIGELLKVCEQFTTTTIYK